LPRAEFSASLGSIKIYLLLLLLTALSLPAQPLGGKIVAAARAQQGVTLRYDPAYVALAFPNGDVPQAGGVCTDVVIRALRLALAADLQALVNADIRQNFSRYPQQWGLSKPDKNIDHRRVPNLQAYFKRRNFQLPLPKAGEFAAFQPGDLVTCTVAQKLPHIMVISDRKSASGCPLVIHNIGAGTQEEDRLREFPLTGHYRWK
jgi:uncharacterized protein